MHGLTAQSPNNFQKPCLCILALDVSGSMAGSAISELNMALGEFYQSINIDDEAAEKLEICLITFGSEVNCISCMWEYGTIILAWYVFFNMSFAPNRGK